MSCRHERRLRPTSAFRDRVIREVQLAAGMRSEISYAYDDRRTPLGGERSMLENQGLPPRSVVAASPPVRSTSTGGSVAPCELRLWRPGKVCFGSIAGLRQRQQ
jgi:hypothetical protein